MSTPTLPRVTPVLSFVGTAVRLHITERTLRKAARLGLVPDRGTVGRCRIVFGSDLPAIDQRMREAGLVLAPDARPGCGPVASDQHAGVSCDR